MKKLLFGAAVLAVPLVLLLAVAVLAGSLRPAAGAGTGSCALVSAGGVLPAPGGLDADQLGNAEVIVGVGLAKAATAHRIVIALATALQESDLHNLDHGDRDSLGLFQQRPSQGWGTPAQVRDPAYAASTFYDRLAQVSGVDTLALTVAAQAVQRSAFPGAYARFEPLATALAADIISAGAGAAVSCVPDGAGLAANAAPVDATGIARDAGDAHLVDSAVVLRHTVMTVFGLRDIGGYRATDSLPGSDHVTGHAVDVMIPGWDSPTGSELGWRVASWARANAAALHVTYVIWANRIWSVARAAEGWRVYCSPAGCPYGANPSPTQRHLDHVHISVGD